MPSPQPEVVNSMVDYYTGFISNPPFDPILQTTYGPDGKTMTVDRGWIVQREGFEGVGGRMGLRFLFNPSTITVSYPSYAGETALPSGIDPKAEGQRVAISNQKLTFALIFDRTREVCLSTTHPGVQVDIAQLQAMTGMKNLSNLGSRVDPGGGTVDLSGTATGVPMWVPMNFFFGRADTALRFTGVIEDFTVEYTAFTYHQTPFRCAVSISATLIPDSVVVSANSGPSAPIEPLGPLGNESDGNKLIIKYLQGSE